MSLIDGGRIAAECALTISVYACLCSSAVKCGTKCLVINPLSVPRVACPCDAASLKSVEAVCLGSSLEHILRMDEPYI